MEDNKTFILVRNSIYGIYYIADMTDKEQLTELMNTMDPYITDDLTIIEYDGDDIADLRDNAVEFDKKFKEIALEQIEKDKAAKEAQAAQVDNETAEKEEVAEDEEDDDLFA